MGFGPLAPYRNVGTKALAQYWVLVPWLHIGMWVPMPWLSQEVEIISLLQC